MKNPQPIHLPILTIVFLLLTSGCSINTPYKYSALHDKTYAYPVGKHDVVITSCTDDRSKQEKRVARISPPPEKTVATALADELRKSGLARSVEISTGTMSPAKLPEGARSITVSLLSFGWFRETTAQDVLASSLGGVVGGVFSKADELTSVKLAFQVLDAQTGKPLFSRTNQTSRIARTGAVSLVAPAVERLNDALQEALQQFVDDLAKSGAL